MLLLLLIFISQSLDLSLCETKFKISGHVYCAECNWFLQEHLLGEYGPCLKKRLGDAYITLFDHDQRDLRSALASNAVNDDGSFVLKGTSPLDEGRPYLHITHKCSTPGINQPPSDKCFLDAKVSMPFQAVQSGLNITLTPYDQPDPNEQGITITESTCISCTVGKCPGEQTRMLIADNGDNKENEDNKENGLTFVGKEMGEGKMGGNYTRYEVVHANTE